MHVYLNNLVFTVDSGSFLTMGAFAAWAVEAFKLPISGDAYALSGVVSYRRHKFKQVIDPKEEFTKWLTVEIRRLPDGLTFIFNLQYATENESCCVIA